MATPKPKAFPRVGTSAARNFFESFARIVTFLNWLLHMASSIDAMVKESHVVLQETEHDEKEKAKREEEWKK